MFYPCISLLVLYGNFAVGQTSMAATRNDLLLKLMTCNLKFVSPAFEPSWERRRDMQIDMIQRPVYVEIEILDN